MPVKASRLSSGFAALEVDVSAFVSGDCSEGGASCGGAAKLTDAPCVHAAVPCAADWISSARAATTAKCSFAARKSDMACACSCSELARAASTAAVFAFCALASAAGGLTTAGLEGTGAGVEAGTEGAAGGTCRGLGRRLGRGLADALADALADCDASVGG